METGFQANEKRVSKAERTLNIPVDSVIMLKGCGESNVQSAVSDVKHFRHQLELTYKQKFTPIMNYTTLK